MAQRKIINKALSVTKRSVLHCSENITEQAQAQSTDINFILRKYQKTGTLEHAKQYQGQYDDVSVQDFTQAMNMVTEAQQMFDELPSSVRTLTKSPQGFLEFTQNPENKDQMIEMGLIQGNDGIDGQGAPITSPTADLPPARS